MDYVLLFLFTFVVGGFVGGTGIGGVLLVPYLVFIIGMETQLAVADPTSPAARGTILDQAQLARQLMDVFFVLMLQFCILTYICV